MAKQTLLDMTQEILSSLNSDEINSISDTVESMQVATIIKRKYFDIISRSDLEESFKLFQLTASGDNDLPVLMYRPDNVNKIEWIKYMMDDDDAATGDNFQYVTILPIQQFMDMADDLDSTEDGVITYTLTIDGNSWTVNARDDKNPEFCTVINNYYILFDSYDADVDTTLQASKTKVYGEVFPTWTVDDSFIPDLDDQRFPLLLNEAKALAFVELKQMPNPKTEQEIKRQWSSSSRAKSLTGKASYFDQLPNFGRRI